MNDALTGEHFKCCCTCDNDNKDLFSFIQFMLKTLQRGLRELSTTAVSFSSLFSFPKLS